MLVAEALELILKYPCSLVKSPSLVFLMNTLAKANEVLSTPLMT